jgi:hypothetical protein
LTAPLPGLLHVTGRDIARRLARPDYQRWADQIRKTGGCAQPVRLRGGVDYLDSRTGSVLRRYRTAAEPGGVLLIACKTRRASRCPSCAETYRADTYQLIRAGLCGGKGVPPTVTGHPAMFVTLTAPSFGVVHAVHGNGTPCHPRRAAPVCPHGVTMSCAQHHTGADHRVGTPLCADCYDYTGTVLFNASAPELWRRFILAVRRRVARSAGLPSSALSDHVVVSFARIAEYQKRGVVHIHAVIRADGPAGPQSAPPAFMTTDVLGDAIRTAIPVVTVTIPAVGQHPSRVMRWGAQLDIRPITAPGLTSNAVAGYIAKYATKAAECTGTLDRPVRTTGSLDSLPVPEHPRRLIAECLRLAAHDEVRKLRLDAWAHMLGYPGHFATKSRHYSTTLRMLRAARTAHVDREQAINAGHLAFDDDDVLARSRWRYAGAGLTAADTVLAAAITGKPVPTALAQPMQGGAS